MDQHREPCGPFDERADRRTLEPDHQVTFPVAGNRTILGFCGTFADQHLRRHVSPRLLACPAARHAQRSAGAQAGDEFTLERSAALNEERLIDRFVADPHRLIIGEVDP
jgi:hypothetical protein